MSDADFIREVEELYQRIAEADTDNFIELAKIAGLDIKTDLVGADLSGADLSKANLSGINLGEANLSGINLSGADLRDANLSGANLSGVYLSGVYLSGVYLSGVWVDLSGTNLREADLREADLSGANLSGAAIPNSNGNIRYRRYLAFMVSREISLISDVFCTSSSNLSLLESQQPANKLDQSLNRALR